MSDSGRRAGVHRGRTDRGMAVSRDYRSSMETARVVRTDCHVINKKRIS